MKHRIIAVFISLLVLVPCLLSAEAASLQLAGAWVVVEGAVHRAGRIQIPTERETTLIEAISLAGGQTRNADLKRVWLIRTNREGQPEKTVVDLDSILKARKTSGPILRHGDRVVVIGRDVDDEGW